MSKARASSAKHEPPPVDDPPDEDEEPVATTGWHVRATRWLRAKAGVGYARAKQALRAKATAAVDGGIAGLQKLRQRMLGAEESEERRGRDRERPGMRSTAGKSSREQPAETPMVAKPRRRLRSFLAYLSVMLAGSMIGMALAYDLLAQLLDRRAAELSALETKLTRTSKSLKTLRKQAVRQENKLTKAETLLAESIAENKKKLDDAEARLAAALADGKKKPAERLANSTDAATRLASAPAAGASIAPGRGDASLRRRAVRRSPPVRNKSVDCTLGPDNVKSILKGCIAEMNGK